MLIWSAFPNQHQCTPVNGGLAFALLILVAALVVQCLLLVGLAQSVAAAVVTVRLAMLRQPHRRAIYFAHQPALECLPTARAGSGLAKLQRVHRGRC